MKKLLLFLILFYAELLFPQDTLLINAEYIPHTDTTLVYYPSNYSSSVQYPLIFMLHGFAGNYAQWSHIVNLQHYADKYNFIIVCPDGFYDSWYMNSPINPKSQFETFFFKNLVPVIFHRYSIDSTNIFITGLSMGGFGAMYLFLKNPNFFKSAGSISGGLDIIKFAGQWNIYKVLGKFKTNRKRWEEHSDFYLLKNIKWTHRPIIISCGTEDFSYSMSERFADSSKSSGIAVTFFHSPGSHSYAYWKKAVPKHFEFFHQLLNKKIIRQDMLFK